MDKTATKEDDVAQVVEAYLAADEAALQLLQSLHDAWRRHFEENAEAPSPELIAKVAEQQSASASALLRAQSAVALQDSALQVLIEPASPESASDEPAMVRTRHRRRRENKFLQAIGKPGQRLLRGLILIALVLSVLVACGAGISLALEIAGFLRLIDDPVQLPVGIQMAIFVTATAVAFGLKKALKPVERALYGSKGVRPKGFSL